MKLLIYSDLHNEFGTFKAPKTDAEVIILAGDIDNGTLGLQWALKTFTDIPVIYVLGNHEFYGQEVHSLIDKMYCLSEGTNVQILEKDSITIENTTFYGCTLWTDFELLGTPGESIDYAHEMISDYRSIKLGNQRLSPEDARRVHKESLAWLKSELSKPNLNKRVVVTHHAPSIRSIPKNDRVHPNNPVYASNLDEFIKQSEIDLWIHGHIHTSSDYMIGHTRVICNPRGYVPFESNDFFINSNLNIINVD